VFLSLLLYLYPIHRNSPMYVLILTLLLSARSNPVLTSSSTEFASEQACNAAAATMAKEFKSSYGEHLPRFTLVCVAK
jgi:hypothetical protein